MTVKTTRALQADRRREELLAAGLRLFAQQGFRATTIADIAEATGAAHGLVYHYFASKDDLLSAILQRYAFVTTLGDLIDVAHGRPAQEVLPRSPSASPTRSTSERFLRLVIAESGTNPLVADALARVSDEGERLLVDYLRARIDAGELRPHDPSVPARALFWAVITKHLGPPRQDDFERDLVTVLLEGIRTR